MRMEQSEIIKVFQEQENLRSLLNALTDKYAECILAGRQEAWADCMHKVVELFNNKRQIKRQDIP